MVQATGTSVNVLNVEVEDGVAVPHSPGRPMIRNVSSKTVFKQFASLAWYSLTNDLPSQLRTLHSNHWRRDENHPPFVLSGKNHAPSIMIFLIRINLFLIPPRPASSSLLSSSRSRSPVSISGTELGAADLGGWWRAGTSHPFGPAHHLLCCMTTTFVD
jgi:hypothetical protein